MISGTTIQDVRLTIEEIETQECLKNLSPEQKLKLINFIYELSLVLYHSQRRNNEQH